MTLALLIAKGGLQLLAGASGGVAPVAGVAVAIPLGCDAESVREWWQERVAIMEWEAGLPPALADALAWERALRYFQLPAGSRVH